MAVDQFAVGFTWAKNSLGTNYDHGYGNAALPKPLSTTTIPGEIDFYQMKIVVPEPPEGTKPCGTQVYYDTNLTMDIFGHHSFEHVGICVDVR